VRPLVLAGVATLLLLSESEAGAQVWRTRAPLAIERSEVTAARLGGRIVVVAGFLADGSSSRRVDAYSPGRNRWSRLRDLPRAVNHAMAAASEGRLYVVGGYGAGGARRDAFVLVRGRWRRLPSMPVPRAAAGAAIVGGKLYVAGGVGPAGLAKNMLAFDLRHRRWRFVRGPTPREHLGVTSLDGRVYAVGGRTAGLDSNLALVESYAPGARRWTRVPPVPEPRGGTGAASLRGTIVSIGGETPTGTIASVYALNVRTRRWRRLPDLPTPRHGLGVVALNGRVYAIAGGRQPGLAVSGVNESLRLR
jgi:N-acetylneuraminic acid mutarotase